MLIFTFGSLAASTPCLGVVLLVIISGWLGAARSLNKQFEELSEQQLLEDEAEELEEGREAKPEGGQLQMA